MIALQIFISLLALVLFVASIWVMLSAIQNMIISKRNEKSNKEYRELRRKSAEFEALKSKN